MLGKALRLAAKIANDKGVAETGYRIVINKGRQGGQVVPHLHFHLIGGRVWTNKMGLRDGAPAGRGLPGGTVSLDEGVLGVRIISFSAAMCAGRGDHICRASE
jgi:diadenosine tetraphosphate (Ap4A) HIT family hydrolase